MCGNKRKAFWSIDAAFAVVLSVAMFAMFSAMLHAAGASSLRASEEKSSSLLSARFSSYALLQFQEGEGADLEWVLARTGRQFASISISDVSGRISFVSEGESNGEIFCTRRILFAEGRMLGMEACIS